MSDDRMDIYNARFSVEHAQNWRAEIDRIPFIKFPQDWLIQVIPPFGDAVVRFRVRLPNGEEKSIYLDVRSSLGYCWIDSANTTAPYWEVYPVAGDVARCGINDVDELLRLIAAPGDEAENPNE